MSIMSDIFCLQERLCLTSSLLKWALVNAGRVVSYLLFLRTQQGNVFFIQRCCCQLQQGHVWTGTIHVTHDEDILDGLHLPPNHLLAFKMVRTAGRWLESIPCYKGLVFLCHELLYMIRDDFVLSYHTLKWQILGQKSHFY